MTNLKKVFALFICTPLLIFAQHDITIDGNFEDWNNVPLAVADSSDDVHDTEGEYPDDGQPEYRAYSDVDILEVKLTNDAENLYGYIKATGEIGRTSSDTLGHTKKGRYYFIFTIDVDDNDTTGYRLKEGGYYPDSKGYDMNMEVEFYNGGFNTGHYINHEFLTENQMMTQGLQDLEDGIVRLAPGTYDWYTQWVTFEDSNYVIVEDKGDVYQGIIAIAVSADGHEAEIKTPMWGFLKTPEGVPIIDFGYKIQVSASLEASGELSEEAARRGNTPGSKSVWGSDTAEPFDYYINDPATVIADKDIDWNALPVNPTLYPNYPNPFNPQTTIRFYLPQKQLIKLKVFDVLGREVATLVEGEFQAGDYSIFWAAKNSQGAYLPSGIYFSVLEGETFRQVGRMLFVK